MKICCTTLLLLFGTICQSQTNAFLDENFATAGVLKFKIGMWGDQFVGSKFQGQDKIVVAALAHTATENYGDAFGLARINTRGELDFTFGTNGIVSKSMFQLQYVETTCKGFDFKKDGKIIMAGYTRPYNYERKAIIMQFDQNGIVDNSFGQDGVMISDFGFGANSVMIYDIKTLADNKSIIVGQVTYINDPFEPSGSQKMFLARINENGTLDLGFANNGLRLFTFSNSSNLQVPKFLNILSDQSLLVSGESDNLKTVSLARFDENAQADSTFGTNGVYTLAGKTNLSAIRVLENGQMFLSFTNTKNNLVKLNADGTADEKFALTQEVVDGMKMTVNSIHVQEDGKVILTGYSKGDDGYLDITFIRLKEDGAKDYALCSAYSVDNGWKVSEWSSNSIYLGEGKIMLFGSVVMLGAGVFNASTLYSEALQFDINKQVNCRYNNTVNVFEIYPNPASGKFKIATSLDFEDLTIELHTIQGQKLLEQQIGVPGYEIDISNLSGIYVYRVYQSGNLLYSNKIVVQN